MRRHPCRQTVTPFREPTYNLNLFRESRFTMLRAKHVLYFHYGCNTALMSAFVFLRNTPKKFRGRTNCSTILELYQHNTKSEYSMSFCFFRWFLFHTGNYSTSSAYGADHSHSRGRTIIRCSLLVSKVSVLKHDFTVCCCVSLFLRKREKD
jgi:hypothetical protein